MQQMKHLHQAFLQREHGFDKILEDADKNNFTNNFHIYRLYVKLKVLVTGLTISRILQIEARMETKSECDIH